jgi:hypothetical protein
VGPGVIIGMDVGIGVIRGVDMGIGMGVGCIVARGDGDGIGWGVEDAMLGAVGLNGIGIGDALGLTGTMIPGSRVGTGAGVARGWRAFHAAAPATPPADPRAVTRTSTTRIDDSRTPTGRPPL